MGLNVATAMSDQWFSNTYLVWSDQSPDCFLVDAGGPVDQLLAEIDQHKLKLTHVLLTHHHHDHIAELGKVLAQHPQATVYAHPLEAELVGYGAVQSLVDGQQLTVGDLTVEAIHTPGHSAGMLALLVNETALFTGDTLFKGSVGGVRAPGHTTFSDIQSSIMDRLMSLDHSTVIYPGHSELTSVGKEWEENPFIRVWRGVEPEDGRECQALSEAATAVVTARDYDGGKKVWVRWPDGQDDILPGSVVELTE